ncbi:uncharacterized protein LOC125809399 [Solanum verrucosum]|uniref:uncharacterized protein LOC125809399 n=1 Tax=Solanum verrucosum TaxID=315347 RepID=UPI0020D09DC4|nr:uncharacterized protein LOC125809399 [Solanum verrucosum]
MQEDQPTASMAAPATSALDHYHSLYLQASDSLGLIDETSSARERYKLGFLDGTCPKSKFRGELEELWGKCNVIVLSWIGSIVYVELVPSIVYASTARKGTDFVTCYYSKMKDLWNEIDVMFHYLPVTFLMGLNENYCSPRTSILSRNANVTVNEAYAIMTQEEGKISLSVVDVYKDPLTMLAGRTTQGYRPKKQGNSGGSIGAIGGGTPCIHCGY